MATIYVCETCGSENIIRYSVSSYLCHCNDCDAVCEVVAFDEEECKKPQED